MALQKKVVYNVQMNGGISPVSLPLAGAMVGDKIFNVYNYANINPFNNSYTPLFEQVISVAGHIQQNGGGDLTAQTLDITLLR